MIKIDRMPAFRSGMSEGAPASAGALRGIPSDDVSGEASACGTVKSVGICAKNRQSSSSVASDGTLPHHMT